MKIKIRLSREGLSIYKITHIALITPRVSAGSILIYRISYRIVVKSSQVKFTLR